MERKSRAELRVYMVCMVTSLNSPGAEWLIGTNVV